MTGDYCLNCACAWGEVVGGRNKKGKWRELTRKGRKYGGGGGEGKGECRFGGEGRMQPQGAERSN